MILVLGNKNYSSWSLRGWLAARRSGAEFDERVFHLSAPGVRDEIRALSPTAKVPALIDGDRTVWDSLAIFEYLAERFPDAGLWPEDAGRRAVARSVTAEMHSGFAALREQMPLNVRRSSPGKGRGPGVREDIERITALWGHCRERDGTGGDFLFGRWCLADAAFAPVVFRFTTYAVEVDPVCRAYIDAMLATPEMQEWRKAAHAETTVEPQYDL